MSKRLHIIYVVAIGLAAMVCISATILTTGKIQGVLEAWATAFGILTLGGAVWVGLDERP